MTTDKNTTTSSYSEEVLVRPDVGSICIAVPHGTDWGFGSLDPVNVEIKAYDGDYVWMLTNNRSHYISSHINYVTFHAVKAKPERRPLSIHELLSGGWYTKDCDHSDAYVLLAMGVHFFEHPDLWGEVNWAALQMLNGWTSAGRCTPEVYETLRQSGSASPFEIYRKGVHFYRVERE